MASGLRGRSLLKDGDLSRGEATGAGKSQSEERTTKDDARHVPSFEELIAQVKDVTLDRVRQLYLEQLGGHRTRTAER